ncbi:MAG: carbohydrate binding family 9 domain-containing protein [Terracidiphilus sp.]
MLACLAALAAQSSGAPRNKQEATHAEAQPARPSNSLKVPLIDKGLHLSDFADMKPRAELKDKLLKISGFIQNTPHDGQPATEETEVWLGYTKNAIYFVFICHDRHPEQIRGHMARRENILKDDYVAVFLDPFQDRRKGVVFGVNPAGVQADASWDEINGTDFSYDQVWDSEGQVTREGWMALIAIPFRSLRFRPNGSDWGVVFQRNFPRNSEQDNWPHISTNITGVLSQEGTLKGIQGVTGSHNVQINPYVLAQNERELKTIDPLNPFFSSRHEEGTAGGEVKAILKDRIVFDATINPDFSNIESDQPQFTVDQRYPVYFPELRPFFLENANYFATPINLVYTRNIVHPEYGGRVTGKTGHTNIGLFIIDDREPGQTVAPGDPLYNKRATIAVGRLSRDLGKGSSIGAIYTDYEFGQGWNRIGGVDFTARFNNHWTALGQMVESSTKGTVDSGPPPTYSAGPASNIQVQRNGHAFNLNSSYLDFSTGFQTQLGFIQTANIHNGQTYMNYQWYPKHRAIQRIGVETNQNVAYDHSGNRVYHYSSFDPYFLLPRNFVLAPIVGQNSDTVGPQNGYLLTQSRNFTENNGGFVFRGAPYSQLNFNITAFRSGNVNYNPVTNPVSCPATPPAAPPCVPFLMNQETVQALFTLQPLRQLTADNTYLLDRDQAVANGALVYESQVFRTKVNYQFTRAMSARVIVEYDSTLANPAETSLKRTKGVGTEALLTWLPHPGTAVYIGYNNDLQNLDRSLCNRLPGGGCDPNNTVAPRTTNFLNDGRQIFIKASYLLRF